MDRVISMIIGVGVAVGGSAIIFIGANKLFDVAPRRWQWFTAATGAVSAAATFAILAGNRIIYEQTALWVALAALIGGVIGYLLGQLADPKARLLVGGGGGALLGLLVGLNMRRVILVFQQGNTTVEVGTPIPFLNYGELSIWVVAALVAGTGLWIVKGRRKPLLRVGLFWATAGWALGAFGMPDLGTASRNNAIITTTGLGLLLGAFLGSWPLADEKTFERADTASRKYIFLTPALFFISASLVVPTLRTFWLSFLDNRGNEPVGLDNYGSVFTDANIIDLSNWTGIFGSKLTWFGVLAIAVGLIAAAVAGRKRDMKFEFGAATISPLVIGAFLIFFAIFAVLRGTIINNLWWVFNVTIIATSLGLAVAVLADRSKRENFAKSIIFMPMAISFVGAGIIWRFMYIARPPQRDQTGVLNSLWVWLGEISNSTSGPLLVAIVLVLIILALAYLGMRGAQAGNTAIMWGSVVVALPLIWLIYRFLGPGIGGFEVVEATGEIIAKPIQFTSERPFNNVWLMLVLIWIQTGFTMVIFSAAIKAVPGDLLEAAKVDGATEAQSFWRVTIPQIAPTIGVVVTTLIVTVMKVFDIVRVMTAGNFDTNVIANEMYDKAFAEFNFGVGSALAVVLFLAILPIMFYNIRRMQKAAV